MPNSTVLIAFSIAFWFISTACFKHLTSPLFFICRRSESRSSAASILGAILFRISSNSVNENPLVSMAILLEVSGRELIAERRAEIGLSKLFSFLIVCTVRSEGEISVPS